MYFVQVPTELIYLAIPLVQVPQTQVLFVHLVALLEDTQDNFTLALCPIRAHISSMISHYTSLVLQLWAALYWLHHQSS